MFRERAVAADCWLARLAAGACFRDRLLHRCAACLCAPVPSAGAAVRLKPVPPDREDMSTGSPRWVDRVYRDEGGGLARSIRRRLSVPDDALDIVHDAFVRVLASGRAASLDEGQPGAYLQRSVTNGATDQARRDLRQSRAAHLPLDEATLPGPDPLAGLEARDRLRRLEQALLDLRPRTRAIYIAHRIHGLSYEEIARTCGITVKGVEKQMSRAIAAIDRRLGRD